MHQREIDNSVSGVMGGVVVGLLLIFGVFYRWPVQTIATIAVCFALYGLSVVVGEPIDRYMANAAKIEAEQQAEEKAKREAEMDRRSKLLNQGNKIVSHAWVSTWMAIGRLTDLERLEYLGNGRAKEFRAKYRLDPKDDPQVSWTDISAYIDADIESGDKQFSRTRAQVDRVLEQLKPAERYLDGAWDNKAYFAGSTSKLVLSERFRKEFDRAPEMVMTHPPVPPKARELRYPR